MAPKGKNKGGGGGGGKKKAKGNQTAPGELLPQHIRTITGNFAYYLKNQEAKDSYWKNSVGRSQADAADAFWDELVENNERKQNSNTTGELTDKASDDVQDAPTAGNATSQTQASQQDDSREEQAVDSLRPMLPTRTSAPSAPASGGLGAPSNDNLVSRATTERSVAPAPDSTAPITFASSGLDSAPTLQTSIVADVKDEVLEMDMETPETAPAHNTLTAEPVRVGLPTGMRDGLKRLQSTPVSLQYPLRLDYFNSSQEVMTNHFKLKLNEQMKIRQYRITPALSGKSKRKIRLIMETAIEQCAFLHDNKSFFATDYFDTIIAWSPIHEKVSSTEHLLLHGDGGVGSRWHLVTLQDGPATLNLELTYECDVDIQSLLQHTSMDLSHANDDLQPVLRALNILVSKSFDEEPGKTVCAGQNKFFLKSAHEDLSNGKTGNSRAVSRSLCSIRGYSYTVKPGGGCVLLNVNAATSAFWKPVPLSVVLEDSFTFRDRDERSFTKALRGVRVYIMHDRGDPSDAETFARLNSDRARVKPIEGFGRPFDQETYKDDQGKNVKVLRHFESTYKKTLKNPRHFAVNLGTRKEPRWYPSEYLRILPYQKYKGLVPDSLAGGMLEVACKRPPAAKALIGYEAIKTMGMTTNSTAASNMPRCGALMLDPRMMKVPSNTIGFPNLRYASKTVPASARWNIQGLEFLRRHMIDFNVVGICATHATNNLGTTFRYLKEYAGDAPTGGHANYGVVNLRHTATQTIQLQDSQSMRSAFDAALGYPNANFALLYLDQHDPTTYALFKIHADRHVGFQSVCVTNRCITKSVGEKISNIMLKLNLKTAGTNHSTADGQIHKHLQDTLVLGADVTHPGTAAVPGTPSIAAIVGSVDRYGGRFLGSMRLQNQARKEIIDHVQPMVRERIRDWVTEQQPPTTKNKRNLPFERKMPANIIYYRDGVSDAQFLEVKNKEIPAIEDAFRQAYEELRDEDILGDDFGIPADAPIPTVKITAIICVKRHGTRFYPLDTNKDRNENCHPGTHVDSVVTSPFFNDFYLQSHAAIKGTAKPCHYFVLRNDMNLALYEIRTLTHELCYTYVRAPCGVSYASPAYYSDRLCERGRIYLRDLYQRTPTGDRIRLEFEHYRHGAEDDREQRRVARYGSMRNANGTMRKKNAEEVEMEDAHRNEVMALCDAWTLRKARESFYGDGDEVEGKNPWHKRLDKTMFWM